ncbi:MAG: redoxin domain-containing protein [Candidatus Omnitrophica bacterium]|nr:redoxin domain-containing protein [Candidatus Omnitrophota bacterium]
MSKKPILIIFFSVDCRICYHPIVNANQLYDKIIHKMEIFGVTRDGMESIKFFKKRHLIKFPLIYDKLGKYHKKFNVKVVPYRVLIKENRIIYKDDSYKDFSERDKEFNEALRTIL